MPLALYAGIAVSDFATARDGRKFVAHGRVTKPGRTLTVTTGDVFAETDAGLKPVATMLATMMAVSHRKTSG
ncbi:hypothetical protein [Corallococcus exercitus]|uniref:hypothetical protein n=1 Tax=Corallococcus exercitus TaxID=2316736 RepID=UPI001C0F47A5|nr:hypothetical protein [Corallococcus exercitus]